MPHEFLAQVPDLLAESIGVHVPVLVHRDAVPALLGRGIPVRGDQDEQGALDRFRVELRVDEGVQDVLPQHRPDRRPAVALWEVGHDVRDLVLVEIVVRGRVLVDEAEMAASLVRHRTRGDVAYALHELDLGAPALSCSLVVLFDPHGPAVVWCITCSASYARMLGRDFGTYHNTEQAGIMPSWP